MTATNRLWAAVAVVGIALVGCEGESTPSPLQEHNRTRSETAVYEMTIEKHFDQASEGLSEYYRDQDRQAEEGLRQYRADARRYGCDAAVPYMGLYDPLGPDRDCADFETQAAAQ